MHQKVSVNKNNDKNQTKISETHRQISQNLDISKRLNERWQYYEGFEVNTL